MASNSMTRGRKLRAHEPASSLSQRNAQRAAIAGGIAVAAAGAAFLLRRSKREDDEAVRLSDAPSWTLRDQPEGQKGGLIGRSVTINQSRNEIYAEWRDFTGFPRFMDNVREVRANGDGTSRWTIAAPGGTTVELVTEITHDVPNERIAWRSTPASQIETAGEVIFEDAPPGRGTVVRLIQTYSPPGGSLGKLIAKLFQREPAIQARRDLRRFKQWMETGEVTVNASPSARTSESPTEARI